MMSDISELIKRRLENYPPDVAELALAAIRSSESGMPESSIADYLENVVRQIIRRRGVGE
jgi:hypothetical protein